MARLDGELLFRLTPPRDSIELLAAFTLQHLPFESLLRALVADANIGLDVTDMSNAADGQTGDEKREARENSHHPMHVYNAHQLCWLAWCVPRTDTPPPKDLPMHPPNASHALP